MFLTQSLSAFNDMLFKTAATMLAVYAAGSTAGEGGLIPALVWGLFMLPYVLFAGLAGQMADKLEKAGLTRRLKALELAVLAAAALGFVLGSMPLLLAAVFLKGASSAFFGPLKYAVLPEHLHRSELAAGYSLVEAGGLIAMLIGTLAGTALLQSTHPAGAAGAALLLTGLVILACAARLPAGRAEAPEIRIDWRLHRPILEMFTLITRDRITLDAVIGKSVFWVTGALFLAEIPAMTRHVLGGAPEIVSFLFVLFSLGLCAGMVGCSRAAGRAEAARHVWIPGLLISACTLDMCATAAGLSHAQPLLGLGAFLGDPARLRIVADLTLVAILSGVYLIPLGMLLQTRAAGERRARIVSADNAFSSLVIVAGMAAASLALSAGVGLVEIFTGFAVLNGLACLYLLAALRRAAPAPAETLTKT